MIATFESIFLIDLIINFFLQPRNEAGHELNLRREQISSNYFFGRFAFDFFILLPHGIVMIYHKNLSSLWLLKTLRLRDLL